MVTGRVAAELAVGYRNEHDRRVDLDESFVSGATRRLQVRALAAQALGLAQGALDTAVGYALERSQFGKKIWDFQEIQFGLSELATEALEYRTLNKISHRCPYALSS